tara:strand:+ start:861 stop:1109 length:249 start_codon:yes stop_codon:yes gene_type:complete
MSNIKDSTSTILAPQASPLKPPIFFPKLYGIKKLKKIPSKIRNKNLINIDLDVIKNNLVAMKIKRKIMEINDSFLNPFQNFL